MDSKGTRIVSLPAPHMRVDAPLPGLSTAASRFFDEQRPEVLHFHTFGFSEALLARMARARGIPYLFTYHSPAWTCRRDTLLYRGKKRCDGEVRAWRCSACVVQERSGELPAVGQIATAGSLLMGWLGLLLGRTTLRRRTAFFFDTLRYRRCLRQFLSECDAVVSCCDWSDPVLLLNGTPPETLRNYPQGVSGDFLSAVAKTRADTARKNEAAFTIGCLSRLTPLKGADIVMEAFSKIQEPRARFRMVGWEPENAGTPFGKKIKRLAESDRRITLVNKTNLLGTIQEYCQLSLLAIPSVWLETGPLTLLEALSLGLPVYGSSSIGQLKLLSQRGRVVQPNTPAGWLPVLSKAADLYKEGLWAQETARVENGPPIRTMKDVSNDMSREYKRLTNRNE